MRIRPLQDWAVIQRTDPEERTAGGIIIPDSAKDKPSRGLVISIGPGRYEIEKGKEKEKKKRFVPTVVVPGQRIMFINHRAEEFELDGEEITMVRERDILGTIEGEEKPVQKDDFPVERKYEKPVVLKEEVMPVPAPVKGTETKSEARTKAAPAKKAEPKKTSPAKKKGKEKGLKSAKKPVKKPVLAKSKTKASKGSASLKKTAPAKKVKGKRTEAKKTAAKKTTVTSSSKKAAAKKPVKKTAPKNKAVAKKGPARVAKKGKR